MSNLSGLDEISRTWGHKGATSQSIYESASEK